MSLHVAPLTTQVWNDYAAMWASRGMAVPGPERPGIYVQNDAGVLMGGIQSFPTDGAWVFLEHLAVVQGLSDEESARVVRFMIQVCKGYSAVVCKKVIILSGPDWCNTLLGREGFEQQGLTPFIYTPAPLPLKASVQDPQVAQLKAELARAKEELLCSQRAAGSPLATEILAEQVEGYELEPAPKPDWRAERDARQKDAAERRGDAEYNAEVANAAHGSQLRADRRESDERRQAKYEAAHPPPPPEPYEGTASTTATDDEVASAKANGMTVEAYRAMVAPWADGDAPTEEPAAPKKKPRTPKQLAADERMRKKK